MPTRRKGRKKYGRKTRKTTSHISPLAHLARKVQGIGTRVETIESKLRGIHSKKRKTHRLGTLEARSAKYWATGE